MASRSVAFFATSDEQKGWLARVLRETGVWCLYERIGTRTLVPVRSNDVEHLVLRGREYAIRIFLGRADLGDPVIREVRSGMELVAAPSLAVQLIPSMQSDKVLTEGHLAILRDQDYDEANVDSAQLERWFQKLAKELREVLNPVPVILYTMSDDNPPAPARGKRTVSAAAFALQQQGIKFKQFVDSRIELVAQEDAPPRKA